MKGLFRFIIIISSITIPLFGQELTIISSETTDGGRPETKASYISRDHVRMSEGSGKEMIVDLKSGQMTTIDLKKKNYYVTTREDMEKFAAQMREQMNSPEMKKAQEQMKASSPADQKKMDDAMSEMFAVDIQKTGKTRRVAGYTCENWTVSIGQFSKSEECITNELQFPAQAWEMYRGFADTMKSAMTAFGPMAKSAGKMQEQFKKMKGYPLANTTTIDIMGRKSVVTSTVTEVRKGAIPASVWMIPAGYTKVDNPMLKAFQRRTKR